MSLDQVILNWRCFVPLLRQIVCRHKFWLCNMYITATELKKKVEKKGQYFQDWGTVTPFHACSAKKEIRKSCLHLVMHLLVSQARSLYMQMKHKIQPRCTLNWPYVRIISGPCMTSSTYDLFQNAHKQCSNLLDTKPEWINIIPVKQNRQPETLHVHIITFM